VATFTKGAMRFVGGKISKNPDGVTVNTPAGALAIRGGMFMTNGKIFAFLFGENMTLTGKNGRSLTVFAPGNLIDALNGEIRETKPGDISILMAALTPGGNGGVTPGQTPQPAQNGVKAATLGNIAADIINEATATQIQDAINKEIDEFNNTPTDTTDTTTPSEPTTTPTTTGDTTPPPQLTTLFSGYAGGTYSQSSEEDYYNHDPRAGTLTNVSPTEFVPLFDHNTQAFQGAGMTLYVNSGAPGEGGLSVIFGAVPLPPETQNVQTPIGSVSLFVGFADQDSITVFNNTAQNPTKLTDPATNVEGFAVLAGFSGAGQILCSNCDFLKWGGWLTETSFDNQNEDRRHVSASGFWVAGDIVKDSVGALPITGGADYAGLALGSVTTDLVQYNNGSYVATGDMAMHWDFGTRNGTFNVANFDSHLNDGQGINFGGALAMPGVPTGGANQFSGQLTGTLPNFECVNPNLTGAVTGSFVKGPGQVAGNIPAAVIGNFAISNGAQQRNFYNASGIFAGSPH
jgi:hypothetical protein